MISNKKFGFNFPNSIFYIILALVLFSCSEEKKINSYKNIEALRDSAFMNYHEQKFDSAYLRYTLLLNTKFATSQDMFYAAHSAAFSGHFKKCLKIIGKMLHKYNDKGAEESASNIINSKWDYFSSLEKERGFQKIYNHMQSYKANYDKPLQKELLQIYKDDQDVRYQYIDSSKKYGYQNSVVDSLGRVMVFNDSVDLQKVIKILDTKGWVGKDKVGAQANQTLFLVIQHSHIKTQEKYLPMMREAVKKGNASGSSLALLEDRIALREGKKQIYGSQIGRNIKTNKYYVLPLEDPDSVDKKRSEVGLDSLTDYVKNWDIIWNVEQYKKEITKIEKWSKGEY